MIAGLVRWKFSYWISKHTPTTTNVDHPSHRKPHLL